MSQYSGKKQHGYWWLHCNGTLQFSTNCHGMKPEEFFQDWTVIKWWHVRCELDWYRMMKEYHEHREGPLEPITA